MKRLDIRCLYLRIVLIISLICPQMSGWALAPRSEIDDLVPTFDSLNPRNILQNAVLLMHYAGIESEVGYLLQGFEPLGAARLIAYQPGQVTLDFPVGGEKIIVGKGAISRIGVDIQGMTAKQLWQVTDIIENQRKNAASFKQEQDLIEMRNRYTARLWDYLEATRSGNGFDWEDLAKRIGIVRKEFCRTIGKYFISKTGGSQEAITSEMGIGDGSFKKNIRLIAGRAEYAKDAGDWQGLLDSGYGLSSLGYPKDAKKNVC